MKQLPKLTWLSPYPTNSQSPAFPSRDIRKPPVLGSPTVLPQKDYHWWALSSIFSGSPVNFVTCLLWVRGADALPLRTRLVSGQCTQFEENSAILYCEEELGAALCAPGNLHNCVCSGIRESPPSPEPWQQRVQPQHSRSSPHASATMSPMQSAPRELFVT